MAKKELKSKKNIFFLTLVAIEDHGSISLVVPALAGIGTVDWQLIVVGT